MPRKSFLDFRDVVLQEVVRMSRTAKTGRVDTSSSPEKPSAANVEASEVARSVDLGVILLSPVSLKGFSRSVLFDLNGVLCGRDQECALRAWNVPKFGYMDVDKIENALSSFVERVRNLRPTSGAADALAAFFDVHWSVNLYGHYFSDACTRTAVVMGCWVTFELTGRPMRLPSRPAYIGIPSSAVPGETFAGLCQRVNGQGLTRQK